MKKKLFIIGFGLLPLWLAIITTLHQGITIATHWYFIFAIQLCIITLAIALFVLFIYNRTSGNEGKKFAYAAIIFAVLAGLAFYMVWGREYIQERKIAKEWVLAKEFVKHNKEVMQKTGRVKDIFPYTSCKQSLKMPYRYVLSVNGLTLDRSDHGYQVYVDVFRQQGEARFTLSRIEPGGVQPGISRPPCQ